MIKVQMLKHPDESDWMEVKERALVTMGKKAINPPDVTWKHDILKARHSPIRHLQFSFYIECPYWVSVHLCRHIHAQPYVKSQRNDRQQDYDRDFARQDQMVSMIWDMNAEELMTIANKRLCNLASPETRQVVLTMCLEVLKTNPEFKCHLIPMCRRENGCNEMHPCKQKPIIPMEIL